MRLRKKAGWGGARTAGSTGIEFCSPGERICLLKLGRKDMGRQKHAENEEY